MTIIFIQALKELSIQDNQIGDRGIQYIADALIRNQVNILNFTDIFLLILRTYQTDTCKT